MPTEPATTQTAPQDDAAVTVLTDAILTRVYGLSPQIATNREGVTVMARLVLADVRPQLDARAELLEARIDDLCDALSAYAPGHPLLLEGTDGG